MHVQTNEFAHLYTHDYGHTHNVLFSHKEQNFAIHKKQYELETIVLHQIIQPDSERQIQHVFSHMQNLDLSV